MPWCVGPARSTPGAQQGSAPPTPAALPQAPLSQRAAIWARTRLPGPGENANVAARPRSVSAGWQPCLLALLFGLLQMATQVVVTLDKKQTPIVST